MLASTPSPPVLSFSGSQSKVQNGRKFFGRNRKIDGLNGLGLKLQPAVSRKQSLSVICGASVQTQTITRKAPTITQTPVHENQKSPKLDDGGSGFPPHDGSGGGGGGGGGSPSSGGFFLLGFLGFMGFLKDKEIELNSRGNRRT